MKYRYLLFTLLAGSIWAGGLAACSPLALPPAPATMTLSPTPVVPATPQPLSSDSSAVAPPTPVPAATLAATVTSAPTTTPTPTAITKAEPTLARYFITPLPDATLVTPIPTPVAALTMPDGVVNILLIGTDHRPSDNTLRTDTLIVASVNKNTGQVKLLSIPRDLFVYIPNFGMGRINQAYGAGKNYPGGGPGILEQTLLYNLGLPIHFYASVNFGGFRQIVDALGGIDVPVTCELTEYKLKDWTLDESDAANYELYTQPVGLTHMDGAVALWYARARPVGGDFFRSYRQRQVLRAIYRAGLQANALPRLPELYGAFAEVVESDLGLWEVMQFAPLAGSLGDTQIQSMALGPNQTTGWVTPRGESVLLPKPEAVQTLMNDLLNATPAVITTTPPITVEIWNAGAPAGWEILAADTLRNDGFTPVILSSATDVYTSTTLLDFSPLPDAATHKQLRNLTHLAEQNIVAQPAPQSSADGSPMFRLILGSDYNPCPRADWMPPTTTGTTP